MIEEGGNWSTYFVDIITFGPCSEEEPTEKEHLTMEGGVEIRKLQ